MKKSIALLLVVLMALSLAACKKQQPAAPRYAPSAIGTRTGSSTKIKKSGQLIYHSFSSSPFIPIPSFHQYSALRSARTLSIRERKNPGSMHSPSTIVPAEWVSKGNQLNQSIMPNPQNGNST